MDTLNYILDNYKLDKEQDSFILLNRSRWGSIPKLFRQLDFRLGAEIGVAGGRFSKFLCVYNPNLKIYAIDAWQIYEGYKYNESQEKMERLYLEAKNRLAPYNCQIVRDWSMEAVKRFADESLDFVFIDANHDYKYVKEDIREWAKKVRKGGIISGHDYIDNYGKILYGVKKAVNEWILENDIKPLFIFNKAKC